MRVRQPRTVVSFHTTADAIRFEKIATSESIEGKLIPAPREITADCGLSWSSPAKERARIEQAIATHILDVEGIYELLL